MDEARCSALSRAYTYDFPLHSWVGDKMHRAITDLAVYSRIGTTVIVGVAMLGENEIHSASTHGLLIDEAFCRIKVELELDARAQFKT